MTQHTASDPFRPPAQPQLQRLRHPGPPRRLSLIVLGLIALATAAVVAAMLTGSVGVGNGVLLMAGLPAAILGAGVMLSGAGRRRGGWMSWLGWPAIVVALPVLALGTAIPASIRALPRQEIAASTGRTVYSWSDIVAAGSGSTRALPVQVAGELVVDLRGMPQDAEVTRIEVELGVGALEVLTDPDAQVGVEAQASVGPLSAKVPSDWSMDGLPSPSIDVETAYTVHGKPVEEGVESSGLSRSVALRPEGSSSPRVTVHSRLGAGAVSVLSPQGVIWQGDASQEVWIIEHWRDEDGRWHWGETPVPGMTHPAVSAEDASVCLNSAQAADSHDDDDQDADWDDWEEINHLSQSQRHDYDQCIQRVLRSPHGASPTPAQPSPTATP